MPFVLPPNFGERVNEIGRLLRSYEASIDEDDKDGFLRGAMIECCELLRSINLRELELKITQVLQDATKQVPGWKQEIIGKVDHFNYFLNQVEAKILQAAKVNEQTQKIILDTLRQVREFVLSQTADPVGSEIVDAMSILQEEVCKLKDEQIQKDTQEKRNEDRKKRLKRIARTLGAVAVAGDSVGSLLFPPATVAGLAASGILGAAAVTLTDD